MKVEAKSKEEETKTLKLPYGYHSLTTQAPLTECGYIHGTVPKANSSMQYYILTNFTTRTDESRNWP